MCSRKRSKFFQPGCQLNSSSRSETKSADGYDVSLAVTSSHAPITADSGRIAFLDPIQERSNNGNYRHYTRRLAYE